MSVPTWDRNASKLQYLKNLYDIECEVLKWVTSAPSKYRPGIGDKTLQEACQALNSAMTAQEIFPIVTKEMLEIRRYHLILSASNVKSLCTHLYVWSDLIRNSASLPQAKLDKLWNRRERIGKLCASTINMIEGVKKSDIKRWNKVHPHDKVYTYSASLFDYDIVKSVSQSPLGDHSYNR